jgi:hypothetical protein
MRICPYSTDFESAVVSLWERCGLIRPWNDPKKDIARKIALDPDLFLIAIEGESLIGTIMIGYEGHRGWINYLGDRSRSSSTGLCANAYGSCRETLSRPRLS